MAKINNADEAIELIAESIREMLDDRTDGKEARQPCEK